MDGAPVQCGSRNKAADAPGGLRPTHDDEAVMDGAPVRCGSRNKEADAPGSLRPIHDDEAVMDGAPELFHRCEETGGYGFMTMESGVQAGVEVTIMRTSALVSLRNLWTSPGSITMASPLPTRRDAPLIVIMPSPEVM